MCHVLLCVGSYDPSVMRVNADGTPTTAREDALYVRKLVNGSHGKRVSSYERGDAPPPSQRALDSLGSLIAFAENAVVCRHIVSINTIFDRVSG